MPLPPALITLGIIPGRSGADSAELLTHDLAGFAQVWALLIAIVCLALAATVATIVREGGGSVRVAAIAAGLASLAGLGWLVTGYGLEYGFVSVHLALPLVFASLAAATVARRRPAVLLAVIALATGVILSTWSPLAAITGSLGLLVAVRHLRTILRAPVAERVLLGVAVAATAL